MNRNPLQDVVIAASYNTMQARRLEGATDMSLMLEIIPALLDAAGVSAVELDLLAARERAAGETDQRSSIS